MNSVEQQYRAVGITANSTIDRQEWQDDEDLAYKCKDDWVASPSPYVYVVIETAVVERQILDVATFITDGV